MSGCRVAMVFRPFLRTFGNAMRLLPTLLLMLVAVFPPCMWLSIVFRSPILDFLLLPMNGLMGRRGLKGGSILVRKFVQSLDLSRRIPIRMEWDTSELWITMVG